MEELPTWIQLIGSISPAGLAGLAFLLVFLGRLIPRTTVLFLAAERDERLKAAVQEKEYWKAAYEKSEENQHKMNQNMETLLSQSSLIVDFLEALRREGSD